MEILLVILLIAAATCVVAIWAFFFIVSRVLRAVFGIAKLPARAARAITSPPRDAFVFDPVARGGDRRCANPDCSAGMPPEARFCGRCGSAVTAGQMFVVTSSKQLRRQARRQAHLIRRQAKHARRSGWHVCAATRVA